MAQQADTPKQGSGDVILVWQNGHSTVLSNGVFFHGIDRPPLSFPFDSLVCESPSGLYFRMVGENQFLLTQEQADECREYAEGFYERGDYAVFAYDPMDENVYRGHMSKSEAEAQGFGWVVDSRPDHDACAWNGTGWTYFHAALTSTGQLRTAIPGICNDFGVLLTKEQFEAMPKRPHPFHVWDFVKEEWKDSRPVTKVRKDALLTLRNHFEAVRWKAYGHYVPQYEQASWPFQLIEAKAWLSGDRDTPKPYLDAFFAECPVRGDGADMREHCERIVRNSGRFARCMGRVNGMQTVFWDEILKAQTAMECDEILRRAESFIQTELGDFPKGDA